MGWDGFDKLLTGQLVVWVFYNLKVVIQAKMPSLELTPLTARLCDATANANAFFPRV